MRDKIQILSDFLFKEVGPGKYYMTTAKGNTHFVTISNEGTIMSAMDAAGRVLYNTGLVKQASDHDFRTMLRLLMTSHR